MPSCRVYTLGFPGEGPQSSGDQTRQQRRASTVLPEGRPVLQRTRDNRARLLRDFDSWLSKRGRSIDAFARAVRLDAAAVNTSLVAYGRELFDAGRPYWIYSETVNSVLRGYLL